MGSPADWAHAGFALGYAEYGHFPISRRAQAACLAIQESAEHFADIPEVGPLILEAGRTEGKRSAREIAHRKVYDFHGAALAAAIALILKRLDLEAIAHDVAEHAQQQASAGSDPVTRRRAVQGIALAAIAAQVHGDDRQALDGLNADGWAHAHSYGTAEAASTSDKGGPPDPAKIAAAASLVLSQIDLGTAASASIGWTQLELQTIAMAAALAAGDGAEIGDAIRKVKIALVDSGRATAVYANQLHAAVNSAYVSRIQTQQPDALFNYVNGSNPCDVCTDDALGSPYTAEMLPDCPEHFRCECNIEAAATSLVNA